MSKFIRDDEYTAAMEQIGAALEAYKTTTVLTSFDGCRLYCESYTRPENTANLVIVHGFTEFAAKYREMIWHFFSRRYNVFIYDQRGHGYSGREVADPQLAHVEHFEDYAKDLDTVIRDWVLPASGGMPVHLFSHSMGGAVALFYLAKHREPVQKAILSSPMVCPITRKVPRPIVRVATAWFGRKYGWTARFPFMGRFDPDADFSNAPDMSYVRFRANLDARILTPEYRTSAATNRWMAEALSLQGPLLRRKTNAAIAAEILLITAGQDTVVKNKPQKVLARRLKRCRHVTIPHAKHTIFSADVQALEEYYQLLFDFLDEKQT